MLCKSLQRWFSDSGCILVILTLRIHILLLNQLWATEISIVSTFLQYSVSVHKCRQTIFFFNTPLTLECSLKFLFRSYAGFIIAQLKTLSIRRGAQGKNNTLIRDGPFSFLGTAMYLLIKICCLFSQKLFFHGKFWKAFLSFIPGTYYFFCFVLPPSSLSNPTRRTPPPPPFPSPLPQ